MKACRNRRQGSPNSGAFCRVAPTRGTVVTSMFRPSRSKLAAVALIAAGLVLAGCGRKAGLDLPPSAAAPAEAQTAQPANTAEAHGRAIFGSPEAGTALPPARGEKKAFVLDPLLD